MVKRRRKIKCKNRGCLTGRFVSNEYFSTGLGAITVEYYRAFLDYASALTIESHEVGVDLT